MQLSSLGLSVPVTYLSHSLYSHMNSHQLTSHSHWVFWCNNIILKQRQLKEIYQPYTLVLQSNSSRTHSLNATSKFSMWSLCHRNSAVQSSLRIPQHFSEQQPRRQWLRPGVQCQQILLCLWVLSGYVPKCWQHAYCFSLYRNPHRVTAGSIWLCRTVGILVMGKSVLSHFLTGQHQLSLLISDVHYVQDIPPWLST